VLLDVQVINVYLFECCTRKHRRRIGCPHYIYHYHTQVKAHDLRGIIGVPNSYSPISRCRNKSCGMKVIPSHLVDCQQMTGVSLLILTRIGTRAFMDFSLFCSDQKRKLVEFVKIEAKTTSESNKATLLFAFYIKNDLLPTSLSLMTSSGSSLFFIRLQFITLPSLAIEKKLKFFDMSSFHRTCQTGSVCF
jgi:hypothetical protein